MGEKFHQFTSKGTEKMGESIGEVIGYFIPDLLLVVFSEGISELIEGALKSVRVVLKGSEIRKLALEAVRVADVAVDAFRVFVEKADIFLDTKYAELKEELIKIIKLIKEWLGIEEEGAEAARTAENAFEKSKIDKSLPSVVKKEKPEQIHHFATNKSIKYTPRMEAIASKYGLDLDGIWNKQLLPQMGRHPDLYHDFVLNGMRQADMEAGGAADKFLELFDKYVKQPIIDNPDLLYKKGWE